MATDAEVIAVRKDSRLYGFEYFHNTSGTKLEMIKQQPPITILGIEKNSATQTLTTDYTFNGYRMITLTVAAVESDVYQVEFGHTVTSTEIGDIVDFSKEEIYSDLRSYYNDSSLDSSAFVADIYQKLAAGYLIMKYWEGYSSGEDFWKMGRNWVDTAHKRVDEIRDGRAQLMTSAGARIAKDISPFQYEILDHAPGLYPSGLYTFTAEDVDEETY